MKKIFCLVLLFFIAGNSNAQQNTNTDGNWSLQYASLKNTLGADLMIRVGDIDNLGYGWGENFNPFFGRSTDPHNYPMGYG